MRRLSVRQRAHQRGQTAADLEVGRRVADRVAADSQHLRQAGAGLVVVQVGDVALGQDQRAGVRGRTPRVAAFQTGGGVQKAPVAGAQIHR